MSLILVPVDLGNIQDVSLRAIETLKSCDVVIVEDFRQGSTTLKRLGVVEKPMELLNEHSKSEDIQFLTDLCKSKTVGLISDCGTPNFCDPGATLIQSLRQNSVDVRALPGPSSLAVVLSLSSEKIMQFLFVGFLPAKTEARAEALRALKTEKRAMVLMDTPYRLKKLLTELQVVLPKRKALLVMNMTLENEASQEGLLEDLAEKTTEESAEFMLLIYSQNYR